MSCSGYPVLAIVSASQSACVTSAQMVAMSIEAVLNQQSAVAATLGEIEKLASAVQQAGGDFPPNQMMLDRLQAAMDAGTPVTGADAVFYTHEASEATMMARGMTYDDAHAAALEKYGVSPFSVYHPDVVQANPGWLNQNWRNFWGLQ
jgi:hypothetical protein